MQAKLTFWIFLHSNSLKCLKMSYKFPFYCRKPENGKCSAAGIFDVSFIVITSHAL